MVHRLRGSAAAAAMLLWSAGLGLVGPVGVNICLDLFFEHRCQKFISPGGTGPGLDTTLCPHAVLSRLVLKASSSRY